MTASRPLTRFRIGHPSGLRWTPRGTPVRQSNRLTVEDRDRLDYYQELRTADAWNQAVQRFRDRWTEHEQRWPADARDHPGRSAGPQAPSAAKPPCGSRNPPQLCQRLDQRKQTHRSPRYAWSPVPIPSNRNRPYRRLFARAREDSGYSP